MGDDRTRLRWNVERRLTFIELRLYWEGRINRGDLVSFFDISIPQASQDLSHYEERAPGNLFYDKTLKTYVASPAFKPRLTQPSADIYLAQLRALSTGGLGARESWIGRPPEFAGTPRLRRHYEPDVLRRLLRCIQDRLELNVRYLSFSDDEPKARRIAPHAVGFDGQRWHVRAFCFRTETFRDFVIGRLSHLGEQEPTPVSGSWDLEWSETVELRLAANPGLPATMRAAIERDLGMREGILRVTTSVCSSYYLESQLNLDIDPGLLAPKRLQIVLTNADQVEDRRSAVKAAAVTRIAEERSHIAGRSTA